MKEGEFSDYIVYVDESGCHDVKSPDPNYPVFVLAFCVFRKSAYINGTVPAVQSFKFNWFGHDGVILHEREIRKKLPPFSILVDKEAGVEFLEELSEIMNSQAFTVISALVDLDAYRSQGGQSSEIEPYHLAAKFCLERLRDFLEGEEALDGNTHVVFEARGKREDNELELEFRRICDGANAGGRALPFDFVVSDKRVNSSGLQIADLIARPIGLSHLRPDQPNRAYEIILNKFYQSPEGEIDGFGRQLFTPDKTKGLEKPET